MLTESWPRCMTRHVAGSLQVVVSRCPWAEVWAAPRPAGQTAWLARSSACLAWRLAQLRWHPGALGGMQHAGVQPQANCTRLAAHPLTALCVCVLYRACPVLGGPRPCLCSACTAVRGR